MEQKDKSWVTSVDVAKRAGVSRSAVSRTFTPGASVAPETRARVMEAAQSLGYQVNILARSMNQGQSNLVGVVITGFTDPFRVALLGEITRSLSEHALVPLLMNTEDPERLSELLRILLSYKISGVIMTSGSPPSAVATEYLQRQVPVAMINRARDLKGVDVANSDNRNGGELAGDRLRRHCHGRAGRLPASHHSPGCGRTGAPGHSRRQMAQRRLPARHRPPFPVSHTFSSPACTC